MAPNDADDKKETDENALMRLYTSVGHKDTSGIKQFLKDYRTPISSGAASVISTFVAVRHVALLTDQGPPMLTEICSSHWTLRKVACNRKALTIREL